MSMAKLPPPDEARADLERAAVVWAATGHGQPLVDAAAIALAVGIDSPTLRLLAGAPTLLADEEAALYGPDTFDELGMAIPDKHSSDAYVAHARLKAAEFLADDSSASQLATDLWLLYEDSDYREELQEFAGLDDWYVMRDQGVIEGAGSVVDAAVAESAQRLVDGLPSRGQRLGDPYMAEIASDPERSIRDRIRTWLKFRKSTRS